MEPLEESLITSWVALTGVLKNNRITQGLNYNEAIVMNIVYHHYLDGEALTSFKSIVAQTKMLKSLVNRTIDSLVRKNLLERQEGADKRITFVRPVEENLQVFLNVHEQSLALARTAIGILGEEDARAFVRIAGRIVDADPLHDPKD